MALDHNFTMAFFNSGFISSDIVIEDKTTDFKLTAKQLCFFQATLSISKRSSDILYGCAIALKIVAIQNRDHCCNLSYLRTSSSCADMRP